MASVGVEVGDEDGGMPTLLDTTAESNNYNSYVPALPGSCTIILTWSNFTRL